MIVFNDQSNNNNNNDNNNNNNNNNNSKKKKNCIYLWNCTFVLLHLELSSVDNDLLWHLISPCPLHPIAISFVCYLLYLHHTSWMSWNYFFKSTENLVKTYYFRLIDKRKGHKQNVCLGVWQLWKMLHWFFVPRRLCYLHFAWLSLLSLLSSFLSIAEGK